MGDLLPTPVFILGAPWQIELADKATINAHLEDKIGLTLSEEMRILVGDWLAPWLQRQIVVHEILHACWRIPIDLGTDGVVESTAVEEAVVGMLDYSLLTVLRDNPELVEWLTD